MALHLQRTSTVVLLSLLATCAVAFAQAPRGEGKGGYGQRPGYKQPEIPKENVRISGTIKGVQGSVIHVVGEGADEWLVKTPDRGGVTVNGGATPEWLARGGRGMMVRFVGTFDSGGRPQSPLNEIYLFTPRPGGGRGGDELQPGVFPEGASTELKGLFAGDDAKPVAPKVMDFRVVGQFAGFGNGTISVAAGRTRVAAKLADDARISVSVGDIRFARLGDKIEVDGWHLPMMPAQIFANRMTITAAAPLGSNPVSEKPAGESPAAEKPAEEKSAE
ncbi:MAG: hypothetical protein RIC55_23575 [Pirellulaceae bacterium]